MDPAQIFLPFWDLKKKISIQEKFRIRSLLHYQSLISHSQMLKFVSNKNTRNLREKFVWIIGKVRCTYEGLIINILVLIALISRLIDSPMQIARFITIAIERGVCFVR